jgi:hypothetical protein
MPAFLSLLLLLLQDWSWQGDSKHYRLQTTKDKEQGQKVLKYMDLVFETYKAFLNPEPSRLPKERFTLVLYRDYDEYKKSGGPGRYGHYDGKRLVGYFDPEQMLPTFAHEGMHQFTDLCIPNFGRVPAWYSEGIAECIANNEVRDGKLYMCLQDGPVPKIRVPILQKAIREKKHYPIAKFLELGKREFQADHRVCYAEGWAFCHFLLTYPKYEDRTKRIPDGQYKKALVTFHNAMLDPKRTAADAAKIAFGGLDLAKLDDKFTEWVLKWPVEYELPKEPYENDAQPEKDP